MADVDTRWKPPHELAAMSEAELEEYERAAVQQALDDVEAGGPVHTTEEVLHFLATRRSARSRRVVGGR